MVSDRCPLGYLFYLFGTGGAYAIDSANCLDNCVEMGGMLSLVDQGEMSDVIDCGLEEIAIIPASTKDSDSNIEVFRSF